MLKSSFHKYQNFFSTRYQNSNEDVSKPYDSVINKTKKSYSIEHLKTIQNKQLLDSRVKDYLTNKKLGLLETETGEQIKLLKKYSGGNKNLEQNIEYLKQLKKQHNQYVNNTLRLNEEIEKINVTTKMYRQKISYFEDTNRFSQETFKTKTLQYNKLSNDTQAEIMNSKVYHNILDRTKGINNYIKTKVNNLRNEIKTKSVSMSTLTKTITIHEKKREESVMATNQYKSSLKRNSLQLNKHLQLAKETIESKLQYLKSAKQNDDLREKAAKEYQLQFLNDSEIRKELNCHKFYRFLLNRIFYREQQKSAPLELAFSIIKNKTAIIDVTEFKNVYFESFEIFKKLEIKVKELQEKQEKLEVINRDLTTRYLNIILENNGQQNQRQKTDIKNYLNHEREEHLKHVREISSKISLWCSRMEYKMKQKQQKQQDKQSNTNGAALTKYSNVEMILQILKELKDKLLDVKNSPEGLKQQNKELNKQEIKVNSEV